MRERIVTVDDEARRFAHVATGGRAAHHNASMQVIAHGPGQCRLVWMTEVLPDQAAPAVAALAEQGARVMKQALEARSASTG